MHSPVSLLDIKTMIRKTIHLLPGGLYLQPELPHRRYGSLRSEVDDQHTPPLEALKLILLRQPKDRTAHSLQFLITFTSNIKFFQALVKEQSEEAQYQCCQNMTYEFHRKNEVHC